MRSTTAIHLALSRVTAASRQYADAPHSMNALKEYDDACSFARALGCEVSDIAKASWE